MNSTYRRTFFTIFAIAYIIALPFLVIFSLGYDLDFKNKTFNNTLSIKIETYPRNAQIPTSKEVFKTPAELRANDGEELTLDVNLDRYQKETFTFKSPTGENSAVKIQNLWLLPTDLDQKINYSGKKFLSILDDDILIYIKNNKYFIQGFSFSGLQGKEEEVNSEKISKEIAVGRWEILLDKVFWQKEQNLLLYKLADKWTMLSLENYPFKAKSVARISSNQLLILDSGKNIWLFNLKDFSFEFIDSGFLGMAFTDSPDMIWLVDDKKIYRILRSNSNFQVTDLRVGIYANNPIIADLVEGIDTEKYNNFVAKNLFLGMVFKIDDKVVYIQDSNKDIWQIIASNVKTIGINNSTLFWLDNQKQLYSYNLFLKNQKSFGKIDVESEKIEDFSMNYFIRWKRLFIYSESEVASVWFDTEVLNESLVRYYPKKWIKGNFCFGSVLDNYQFCINEDNLITYKNNVIPF